MDRSSSPRMRRRILMTLFVAQSMTSAAMTGLTAISAIVAAGLGGYDALAGLPMTFLLVGAASAAYPASRVMDRLGRRWGLGLAGLIGSSGMLLAGSAVLAQSFGGF